MPESPQLSLRAPALECLRLSPAAVGPGAEDMPSAWQALSECCRALAVAKPGTEIPRCSAHLIGRACFPSQSWLTGVSGRPGDPVGTSLSLPS